MVLIDSLSVVFGNRHARRASAPSAAAKNERGHASNEPDVTVALAPASERPHNLPFSL
jgi:hypothetical protein